MNRRRCTLAFLTLALALWVPASAEAQARAIYVHVALFDVREGQTEAFENALVDSARKWTGVEGFINERVLRNIDPRTRSLATYSKFDDRSVLEELWKERLGDLKRYLIREPETHVAVLLRSYSPSGVTAQPTGLEFGEGKTQQIAHVGLFIPFPAQRDEYDEILDAIKRNTLERKPEGYLGEDVLTEMELLPPKLQSPYSPRAREPARMSINYGEYTSVENAENAYILRAQDRPNDPLLVYWDRAFYSSLQVPTRFYIWRVIANLGPR